MSALFRDHPRILIAAALGAVVGACLPAGWPLIDRLLVAWDCGAALFLVLMYMWMNRLSAERIRSHYADEDEPAQFILVIVICAAFLSIVAIVEPLATLKSVTGPERLAHIALAAITLLNSWLVVPVIFTVHYADIFYSTAESQRPLQFPATPDPDFWDFAYFSFTIAAACQTSDVSTTNSGIRRVVIAQTLVSFVFNLAILGFAINVTAGLIGN